MTGSRRTRGVRGRHGLVADGLFGGILFGGALSGEEMLDSTTWEGRIERLWHSISNWRFVTEVLSDRLATAFSVLAWRQWNEQARP